MSRELRSGSTYSDPLQAAAARDNASGPPEVPESPQTQPTVTPPSVPVMTPEQEARFNALVAQQVQRVIATMPSFPTFAPVEPRARKPNLKAPVPESYKGKSHKELHEFLRQCTEYFRASHAHPDDPETISFAGLLIRDSTAGTQWERYRKLQPPGHQFTWNEFATKLRDILGDEATFVNKTWKNFFGHYQRAGESIQSFADNLWDNKSLLEEYNPSCAPTEGQTVKRFLDAMRPEIFAELSGDAKKSEKWESFLKNAIAAEANATCRKTDHHGASGSKRPRSREPSPNARAKGRGKDKRRDTKTRQESTPASGANADEAHLKCYTCGKPGHKANNPVCERYDKAKYEGKAKSTN